MKKKLNREALELQKLAAEIERIQAEAEKLRAEALKIRRERTFHPMVAVSGITATVVSLLQRLIG